jgi:hypothetical protein
VAFSNPRGSRWLAIVLTACALLILVAIYLVRPEWLSPKGNAEAELVLAVIGVAVTVLGVILTAMQLRQPAQEVEMASFRGLVRGQWEQSAKERGLNSSNALPISWRFTDRPVTDGGNPVPSSEFEQNVPNLSKLWFVMEATRQLAIIGEPGAGKTSALILLARQILLGQSASERVPLGIDLANWNPEELTIDKWMEHRLVEEFPTLKRKVPTGGSAAKFLVDTDAFIPFFDGLDELSDPVRAVTEISAVFGKTRAFAICCRAEEYEHALRQYGEPLADAYVIELNPVSADQVADYLLNGRQLQGAQRWLNVVDRMRAHPSGPLATAMSSPLMTYLAHTAYRNTATADDLLELETREAVENQLLESYLPAFYRDQRPATASQQTQGVRAIPYPKALKTLRFLAQYLESGHAQSFTWWDLHRAGGPKLRWGYSIASALAVAVLVGIPAGPVAGLAFGFAIGLRIPEHSNPVLYAPRMQRRTLVLAIIAGAAVGLVAAFQAQILQGALLGLVTGVAFWHAIKINEKVDSEQLRWSSGEVRAEGQKVSLRLAFAAGLTIGIAALLVSGLAVAVVLGAVGIVGGGVAGYLDTRSILRGITGAAAFGLIGAIAAYRQYDLLDASLLAGGTLIAVLVVNSWCRFAAAQVWLASQRRLPLGVLAFLEAASDDGIMRRSGAGFEFRHLRIQAHFSRATGPVANENE